MNAPNASQLVCFQIDTMQVVYSLDKRSISVPSSVRELCLVILQNVSKLSGKGTPAEEADFGPLTSDTSAAY